MRVFRAFAVCCLFIAAFVPTLALADYNRSRQWFNSLSAWERRGIQINLIATGSYTGFADAEFGRNTYDALLDFENKHSIFPNGILSRFEAARLVRIAQEWRDGLQFADSRDDRAGVSLPVPYALVSPPQPTERGAVWPNRRSALQVETSAFDAAETSLDLLYLAFTQMTVSPGIKYKAKRKNLFVVSGESGNVKYYSLYKQNSGYVSGFTVTWSDQIDDTGSRVAIYIASKAQFFEPRGPPLPSLLPHKPGTADTTVPRPATASSAFSGSGFFVSSSGLILTNNHVVDKCATLDVPRFGSAEVLRTDEIRDLAMILVAKPPANQPVAKFSRSPPALGSAVVVGGFPLSDLFNSDFTVAFGAVTGRHGLGGNQRQFSISAPIQPGNSGGPIINDSGEIVGIAVSKLNDAKMMEMAGSTGANFSFAIDATRIGDFLRPFSTDISRQVAGSGGPRDNEALARELESYSVQIICRRNG